MQFVVFLQVLDLPKTILIESKMCQRVCTLSVCPSMSMRHVTFISRLPSAFGVNGELESCFNDNFNFQGPNVASLTLFGPCFQGRAKRTSSNTQKLPGAREAAPGEQLIGRSTGRLTLTLGVSFGR